MRLILGLGSNLGDRISHLRSAADLAHSMLARPNSRLEKSRIYETEPVDCTPDSGKFLNAAVAFECDHSASEILSQLQTIERGLGRPANHGFHEPRTIDLDILALGNLEIHEPDLRIPHPGIPERGFVLLPLRDLDPTLRLPSFSPTIAELCELADIPDSVREVAQSW